MTLASITTNDGYCWVLTDSKEKKVKDSMIYEKINGEKTCCAL
jgi:hypothetical protein